MKTDERNDNDNPSGRSLAGGYVRKSFCEAEKRSMENAFVKVIQANTAALAENQNVLKETTDELKKSQKNNELLFERFDQYIAKIFGNQSNIEEMKHQLDALQKEHKDLIKRFEELSLNQYEKEKILKELQNETSRVETLHQNNETLQEERDKLLADKLVLEKNLNDLQAKLQNPAQQALFRAAAVEKKRIKKYQSQLEELESMRIRIACLTTENSTLKIRIRDLNRRLEQKKKT